MQINLSLRLAGLAAAVSLTGGMLHAQAGYSETRLVADLPGKAQFTDPNLVNPWGLCLLDGGEWWVSDNGTGLSTLYDGSGNIQSLVVTIPPSASSPSKTGTPTGCVGNSTTDFNGAFFLFDSEDGVISAWSGGASATIAVDKGIHAVYKGLAIGAIGNVNVLYAANFRSGKVETYDMNFNGFSLSATAFTDSKIPAGYAPFGIQTINGNVFVTFAKQDAKKHDEVDGAGLGYVDEFDPAGNLIMRLQHVGEMNGPWGIALAGTNFGAFSGDLLVGNFGNGQIAAFDPSTGKFLGVVSDSTGKPIIIPGLWAIYFGQGGNSGPSDWLYFTAGVQGESHGLFGFLSPQ